MSELSTLAYNAAGNAAGFFFGFGIIAGIGCRTTKPHFFSLASTFYSLPLPMPCRVGAAAANLLAAIGPRATGTPILKFRKLGAFVVGSTLTYYISSRNNEFTLPHVCQSLLGIGAGITVANALAKISCKKISA